MSARELAAHQRGAPALTLARFARRRDYNSRGALGPRSNRGRGGRAGGRDFLECVSGVGGRGGGRCESGKMAAAAVVEFQRAQSLLSTDREASIDILHSIGKGCRAPSPAPLAQLGLCRSAAAERGRVSRLWCC